MDSCKLVVKDVGHQCREFGLHYRCSKGSHSAMLTQGKVRVCRAEGTTFIPLRDVEQVLDQGAQTQTRKHKHT